MATKFASTLGEIGVANADDAFRVSTADSEGDLTSHGFMLVVYRGAPG